MVKRTKRIKIEMMLIMVASLIMASCSFGGSSTTSDVLETDSVQTRTGVVVGADVTFAPGAEERLEGCGLAPGEMQLEISDSTDDIFFSERFGRNTAAAGADYSLATEVEHGLIGTAFVALFDNEADSYTIASGWAGFEASEQINTVEINLDVGSDCDVILDFQINVCVIPDIDPTFIPSPIHGVFTAGEIDISVEMSDAEYELSEVILDVYAERGTVDPAGTHDADDLPDYVYTAPTEPGMDAIVFEACNPCVCAERRYHFDILGGDCEDADDDGVADHDDTNCPAGTDFCDDDANNWTAEGCADCADNDGDGYFAGCDAYTDLLGPDADDDNPNIWTADGVTSCVDTDGDGYFVGCDAYDTIDGPDECDGDFANWTVDGCANCIDGDDDGRGLYCDLGSDCDDIDGNNWLQCATCIDADGDGWYVNCDSYVTIPGPDSDDSDPDVWTPGTLCVDTDGDGWYVDCDAYSTINGPDCDDGDNTSNESCGLCTIQQNTNTLVSSGVYPDLTSTETFYFDYGGNVTMHINETFDKQTGERRYFEQWGYAYIDQKIAGYSYVRDNLDTGQHDTEGVSYYNSGEIMYRNFTYTTDIGHDKVIDYYSSKTIYYSQVGYKTAEYIEWYSVDYPGYFEQSFWNYDADGNLTNHYFVRDDGRDEVWDYYAEHNWEFDTEGNLLMQAYERDSDGDGFADYRYDENFTYDANGRLLTQIYEEDRGANGSIDNRYEYCYSYDVAGNKLSEIYERDYDADGSINYRYEYSYSYDVVGNQLSEIYERDSDADGSIDYRYEYSFSYDVAGNQLSVMYELDLGGAGSVDYSYEINMTYDAENNRLTRIAERDSDYNGSVDSRTVTTWTYDENANVLEHRTEWDYNADDVLNEVEAYTYTYHEGGEQASETHWIDYGADGIYYLLSISEWDIWGNLILDRAEDNWNGDDVIDSVYEYVCIYDADGNLLESSRNNQDFDNPSYNFDSYVLLTYDDRGLRTSLLSEHDDYSDDVLELQVVSTTTTSGNCAGADLTQIEWTW
jgi:hypothetical protein